MVTEKFTCDIKVLRINHRLFFGANKLVFLLLLLLDSIPHLVTRRISIVYEFVSPFSLSLSRLVERAVKILISEKKESDQ